MLSLPFFSPFFLPYYSPEHFAVGALHLLCGYVFPLLYPFLCPGKLYCMDYIHWVPLHSGFHLNFASGGHQQGQEGEGREASAFIPSASTPAGPWVGKRLLSTSKATPPVGRPSTSTAVGIIWDTARSPGGGSF